MNTPAQIIHQRITETLNKFPEVKWDRFGGDLHALGIYGWIDREDGKRDFILIAFMDGVATSMGTSSAKFSAVFADRLDLTHGPCNRVEDHFKNVNAIKL